MPADGFFAAVQLRGDLSAGQALNEQAHHLQFPFGQVHQRRFGTGRRQGLGLENPGKRRAEMATTPGHVLYCSSEFTQGAVFVEQSVGPLVEQRLQQGRIAQHGHHDQADMAEVTFHVAHQR
ncbi:hypothetical protein D3C71_1807440 [compost metagenome]